MYQLYMGYKNYSSWSLRPWLLLKHFDIAFEEKMVDVAGRSASDMHRPYSANGLVPCLHDNGFQVWDTLAIAEFLHDVHPELGVWPQEKYARARARSVSAELHSGFSALRTAMPMNIKFRLKGKTLDEAVTQDLTRMQEIWRESRREFAGDKPYLFGDFSAADAMFAPVVWRLYTYNVKLDSTAQAYCDTMLTHPAMQAWEAAALAETTVLHYDAVVFEEYGGAR